MGGLCWVNAEWVYRLRQTVAEQVCDVRFTCALCAFRMMKLSTSHGFVNMAVHLLVCLCERVS
jgi:hypothetical protein